MCMRKHCIISIFPYRRRAQVSNPWPRRLDDTPKRYAIARISATDLEPVKQTHLFVHSSPSAILSCHVADQRLTAFNCRWLLSNKSRKSDAECGRLKGLALNKPFPPLRDLPPLCAAGYKCLGQGGSWRGRVKRAGGQIGHDGHPYKQYHLSLGAAGSFLCHRPETRAQRVVRRSRRDLEGSGRPAAFLRWTPWWTGAAIKDPPRQEPVHPG